MKKMKKTNKNKPKIKPKTKPISRDIPKIAPLGSRVLIKPFTKDELMSKNSFGIILPGSDTKEKSEQGMVIAVGPGEHIDGKLVSVNVKVGDKVAFSKYGYEDITIDGEELYLIKEENILAILR